MDDYRFHKLVFDPFNHLKRAEMAQTVRALHPYLGLEQTRTISWLVVPVEMDNFNVAMCLDVQSEFRDVYVFGCFFPYA